MLVGITDAGGNLIARYSYDEWGKLLSIEPAEEDNEEQLSIAQLNPLRYRGYYYDTESGLYYINSRYYSPELCRFISCGDYSSIDYSNKYGLNAYSYCYNSPASVSNYDGTYKSSIDTAEIKQFLKNSIKVIKILNDEFAKALGIDKENIKKKANQILDKTKKFFDNMISRYNTFIDKLEYAINYPDAVINNALSKIFNKDVNIRFKIIENIRANSNLNIDLSNFKFKMDENSGSSTLMKKAKGYVTEAGKTVGAVIVEIFTCLDLQEIAKELGKTFSFNNFEDYMQQKVDLYTEWFEKVNKPTRIIDKINKVTNGISWLSSLIPEPVTKTIVSVLPFFTTAVKDFSGKYISTKGSALMLGHDWLIYSAGLLGAVGGSGGKKLVEGALNFTISKFFDIFALHNAEYYAYNWYLLGGTL